MACVYAHTHVHEQESKRKRKRSGLFQQALAQITQHVAVRHPPRDETSQLFFDSCIGGLQPSPC